MKFALTVIFCRFGYDQGIFGGLLGNDNFIETFDNPSAMTQGQITATYDLGCFFGAIGAMALGGVLGRVRGIWWGCFILVVGAILQASSYSVAQMVRSTIQISKNKVWWLTILT